MVTFPNCKINLGLRVLGRRTDGFHNIETVFLPVPIYDALEMVTAPNETKFSSSGFDAGPLQKNLCLKAYHLIKKDMPQLPDILLHLHKAIPVAAGLGGGSSDAAFTLLLLNEKFGLQLSEARLQNYAVKLGSDCAFFLLNKACVATGRGEILEAIPLSLSKYKLLIVNPPLPINTRSFFGKVRASTPRKSIKEIIQQPLSTWKHELINDFEKIAFAEYPELQEIKEILLQSGAVYASMSGTGSTFYGIFETGAEEKNYFGQQYFSRWVSIK